MLTFSVIEYFDIVEDCSTSFFTGLKTFLIYQFSFDSTEKRFSACIIITIAFPAHAANKIMLFKQFLIIVTAILHSTI